jgi:hypothetical protein
MNRIVKEIELTFEEYNKRLMDISRYIGSDGSGNYNCTLCDHKWRAYKRYLYWPVFLRWQRNGSHRFITWHGWSVGYEGLEQGVFGWTLHIGPLKICFGSMSRLPEITRYTYMSPATPALPIQDDILSASYISETEQ